MTVRVTEQAIEGSGGEDVLVRRDPGSVKVAWFCGESRTFTDDGLRELIAQLEAVATVKSEVPVWIRGADQYGGSFYARVADGELFADNTLPRNGDEADSVPWPSVRKALKKALD